MSYQLVDDLRKKATPSVTISQTCSALGISRSGYYANRATQAGRKLEPLVCASSVHLKAAFAASGKSYGSRRLQTAMAERGLSIGRHRVRSLMRIHGLQPVWRRKFVHTTDSKHGMAVASNVLNRQFDQVLPNRAWAADITYIRTRSGWLYLAVVLDLHSRKIVGWAMAAAMPADLVCAALQMAVVV
jgi:transposase InsO family protein